MPTVARLARFRNVQHLPRSVVINKVPPRRLSASPSEDTVTSIVCPGLANAGNVACTETAATFLGRIVTFGGIVTPYCLSMLRSDCAVNGAAPFAKNDSPRKCLRPLRQNGMI